MKRTYKTIIALSFCSVISCSSSDTEKTESDASLSTFLIGGGECVENSSVVFDPDSGASNIIEQTIAEGNIDCSETPSTELGAEFSSSISEGGGTIRLGSIEYNITGMITNEI